MPRLAIEENASFDLVFIDADKPNTPDYFQWVQWALKLCHRGSVIIVDNVIRNGAVIDPANTDPNVVGMRRFIALLGRESRVAATTIQTVGSKGYDGFTLALVVGDPEPGKKQT